MRFRLAAVAPLVVLAFVALAPGLPARAGRPPALVERAAFIPVITAVEPSTFNNQAGGTLSIIGRDILTGTVVRLVDFGVLTTEFVNEGSLRAIVPLGIYPRRYAIELIEPDGTTVLTPFSIDVFGPTPTPGPTAAPPTVVPGKPLVALRNFVIDPPKPIVGREFTLTVELYNTGSRGAENTLVTFSGGNFTPVGNANGYLVGFMHINGSVQLSQRFRVPTNLQSQIYELKFNVSANDWSGENYQYPQSVPVEVIGVHPGKPQVVINAVRTEPALLQAGQPFTLYMSLSNHGSRTAVNTLVSLVPTTDVLPSTASNVINIDYINVDAAQEVAMPLILATNAGGGRRTLDIALDYTDWVATQTYSARQTVSINVQDTPLSDRPQLVLTAYRTDPPQPAPGEAFTLTYSLSNVGGGEARRLIASLGGENGANLKPFAPLNSGNVKFVPALKAGETIDVVQQLVTDAASDSGAFNLPVALTYDDVRDQRRTDQQIMSLVVRRVPLLRVSFNPPVIGAVVGQPFQLPVEVVNIGRKLVNANVVEVSSPQMAVQNGSLYVGALDAGASTPIQAVGIPAQAGSAEVQVAINYIDELNQPQRLVTRLSVDVQEAPPAPPPGETPQGGSRNPLQDERPLLVRLLNALFGLGS
jgi:hypothetical protein